MNIFCDTRSAARPFIADSLPAANAMLVGVVASAAIQISSSSYFWQFQNFQLLSFYLAELDDKPFKDILDFFSY